MVTFSRKRSWTEDCTLSQNFSINLHLAPYKTAANPANFSASASWNSYPISLLITMMLAEASDLFLGPWDPYPTH